MGKTRAIKNCYTTCMDDCKYAKKKSPVRCVTDCSVKCSKTKNNKAHGKLVRPVPRREWSKNLPSESEEFTSSTSGSDSSSESDSEYTSTSSSSSDSMKNYYKPR